MTKSTPSPGVPPKRNLVIVTIDIIVAVALVVIGLTLGLYVLTSAAQFPKLLDECGSGPFSGLECSGDWVATWGIVIVGIAIFSFAITTGLVFVNIVRKRPVWYWPLIGIIVTTAGFYAGTALVSLAVPSLGAPQ